MAKRRKGKKQEAERTPWFDDLSPQTKQAIAAVAVAVVGVFSYEIAETKVTQVMEYARRNEHPLQCTMEKE